MSDDIAISVQNVSKAYRIWRDPSARLKAPLKEAIRRILPQSITNLNSKLKPRAENQSPYYKDFYAIKNASFDIRRGEAVGIVGRNGSGKSTILQIIAGTLTPSSGKVITRGRVAALLELGSGFNPEFTGIENIHLNASVLGLSRENIEKKKLEIIKFADIGDFINQPVKTYSSGMLMRLAFSVQIAVEPEILIIDEALAVGDIFFTAKCLDHMKLKMANTTRLFVSHDMGAIANLCDRALFFDKGEIIMSASPLECIEAYTKHSHSMEKAILHNTPTEKVETEINFTTIPDDKCGGAGQVRIKGYSLRINGNEAQIVARPGDQIHASLLIECQKNVPQGIIGYLATDIYGNRIFGENTLSSLDKKLFIKQGAEHVITIKWHWPEVKEGNYLLTFGIGEGIDPIHHQIQCWAHNIISIKATCGPRPVHALFNVPLTDCSISP